MSIPRIAALSDALAAAGIPVVTVRQAGSSTPEIVYADAATQQQRTQGAAILAAFDARPRRARPISAIAADINALSAADQRKLSLAIQAFVLQGNPGLARALSLAIDGDEPDV